MTSLGGGFYPTLAALGFMITIYICTQQEKTIAQPRMRATIWTAVTDKNVVLNQNCIE